MSLYVSLCLAGTITDTSAGGRGTIPRAGFTAGIVTSLLQLTVNQFRVVRLHLLARHSADEPTPTPTLSTDSQSDSKFDISLRSSLENPTLTAPTPEEESKTLPGRMIRGLATVLPVRKVSDDDYLALLIKKRNEVERRLKEIEQEEWRIYETATKGQST